MQPFKSALLVVALAAVATTARAQMPLPFQTLESPAKLEPGLRQAIEALTPRYPFEGFRQFGADSVLLVFSDSALTGKSLTDHTWMFGPPVTDAEADSCPPRKVLGRKIARVYWRAVGSPKAIQVIMVAVHGTSGVDRWSVETMFYPYGQLAARWVGDGKPR
jgi:hypothetical protein